VACLKIMGFMAVLATVAMLILNAKEIKRYIQIESM
jgi:hypothetical protein